MAPQYPPAGVERVVVQGKLAGGEVWAAGWWQVISGEGVTAQAKADSVAALGAFTTWLQKAEALASPDTTFDTLTLSQYREHGPVTDVGSHSLGTAVGAGTSRIPNQIALVLTMRSALRTASGRNRMYLPCTGLQVLSTGLLTTAPVTAMVGAHAALMRAVSGVCVSYSRQLASPMLSVDADYIPDQQTRRREALISARTSAPVPLT